MHFVEEEIVLEAIAEGLDLDCLAFVEVSVGNEALVLGEEIVAAIAVVVVEDLVRLADVDAFAYSLEHLDAFGVAEMVGQVGNVEVALLVGLEVHSLH